ncbi:MAG: hypothetical protein ABI968_13365 [Acidobacteriota bacterium]
MKKLLSALLLVGAIVFAYRWFTGWTAYRAYERFAEAWVHGDGIEAAKYGDAPTVKHALEERSLRGTPGGAAMEAFRGERYAVESQTRSSGGAVELKVLQTIFFDPPGITSGIGGAMLAHFRHKATVRKTSDGWRVVAFEPTYLDMASVRPGRS